jgi:hypothetical protein
MTNLIRKCPECNRDIKYTSKQTLKSAENKNSKCKSCGIKSIMTDEYRKKISDRVKGENNPMYGKFGELNHFYGKKHNEESKKKIVEGRDYSKYKSKEFREKMSVSTKGIKNPMYGKSVYDIWSEKYGKEIADEKLQEYKKKQSYNTTGEKNPMYGRPAPKNSGNGICGWYKDWFFRSILELSYMIFVIERFNFKWETAENSEFKVEYNIDGVKRNYFPDFVLNGKYVVECKPKKLWDTSINKVKFNYAEKFYRSKNMKFKVTDITRIQKKELIQLINSGLVVLTNKWKHKILS